MKGGNKAVAEKAFRNRLDILSSLNADFQKNFGTNTSLSVGVASRTGAAIIPRFDLRYNKVAVGVSFESTTGKMKTDNLNRNATEVVLGFIL